MKQSNKTELVLGLSANNPILEELFEDWISITDFSFWRFFKSDKEQHTEKKLRAWEKFLRSVITKYNAKKVITYKCDVKGMIIVLDTCVVRTYRSAQFLKIRPLYRLKSPYLEKLLMSRQLGTIGVFVCEKIQPLVDIETMALSMKITPKLFEKMNEDVLSALNKIHSYGYCHDDTTLDNCGYNKKTGNFVLFDYDGSYRTHLKTRKEQCRDFSRWSKSLETWKKYLP